MPRELRKRASRVNYAELARLDVEDEEEAGPSEPTPAFDDEEDSGSDFTPEIAAENGGDIEAEVDDDDVEEVDELSEADGLRSSSDRETSASGFNARSAKASKSAGRRSVRLAHGVSMGRIAASAAVPSLHHRHRAIPIHQRRGRVERLKDAPRLFREPEVIPTNSWSGTNVVIGRVNKAWGYNVGPGPLFELLEDRAWFKEVDDMEQERESIRRPKVYQDVTAAPDWQCLTAEEAHEYLPSRSEDNPQVKCFFGPIESQRLVETRLFDTFSMEKFFPGSSTHVFDAGAPVWGLDWCPIHPDDRSEIFSKQYLAVGPLPLQTYTVNIGMKKPRPNPACIQIWSLGASPEASDSQTSHDGGVMKCEMVLCLDSGPAQELRWCPLPSHDSLQQTPISDDQPRTLGILAGTFEDGSLSIYVVPYPEDVRRLSQTMDSGPVYVKLPEPLLRFELEDTACWSLDWGNSEVIATGCTNGAIAVWDIKDALRHKQDNTLPLLPTHYFSTHQCAIRSIAWIRAPTYSARGELSGDDPTVILGGGYDGLLSATDIREPCGNEVYRTRDVVNTVCYSTYTGGPVSVDQGQIKTVSFAPIMLNKGHTLLDPDGAVWDLNASDYHPQLAVGVSDGSCITTNTLRSTRRGGSVPFLMHKIYQMDYSRKTGEFRMLDHILPKEIDRAVGIKAQKPETKGGGAWPPEIGVQRVVWNSGNGLANAPLLASATGCGLCRIDYLKGKWLKDRMPYYGIEGIRAEIDADDEMEEDSD